VNDTANGAKLTGRLLAEFRVAEGGTTCIMHTTELVMKHAIGLSTRRAGGQVCDSFAPGKDLRDVCKGLAAKVMDKKAKGRFLEYEDLGKKTWGVSPIKLKVPNETRVGGVYILMVSLLRAKNLLQVLMGASNYQDVYKTCMISNDDWKLMAEFEAIISHVHHLAVACQGNETGEIAFSWFEVSMCLQALKSRTRKYNVVDVSKSWAPNCQLSDLPTQKLDYAHLSSVAQNFIDRLVSEFAFYFPGPDSDQLVAMHLHPVTQKNTFE
jgi:hypothetical protein